MTPPKFQTMDELMAEHEAEILAKANSPEGKAEQARLDARLKERLKAEHEKGVRLGWWDEEGNPLTDPEAEDEDEDEDGDEDDAEID